MYIFKYIEYNPRITDSKELRWDATLLLQMWLDMVRESYKSILFICRKTPSGSGCRPIFWI